MHVCMASYMMAGYGHANHAFRVNVRDAPLSPLLDPLEGPSRLSCGKLGLEGHSRLPALERGRRAC
jgi:hypothetical protein